MEGGIEMKSLVSQAGEHWPYIAPLISRPRDEAEYDGLLASIDELLGIVKEDENHPLASLLTHLSDLVEQYDREHRPRPKASGEEVLRYLMGEHRLKQNDLPELGSQSVVSEILAGKRKLNLRQIRWLVARFSVPADVFI
jgi:HTH-type transcriptional regulator/antitoxin HigA